MRTPLAWRNLLHERYRAGVAIAGVALAVMLILMQLGFFFSVQRTATLVYDQLNFDLAIVSHDYLHMGKASSVPLERLYQSEGVAGVARAQPFWISFSLWLNPDPGNARRRSMMILALRPEDAIFTDAEIDQQRPLLKESETVLVDRRSRPEFGPHGPGVQTEIGSTAIRVAGEYTMGTGFSADGGIVTSDRTFRRLLPFFPRQRVSLGLITLQPGADPDAVVAQLMSRLPPDVQIMTRAQLRLYEQHHWVVKTSVGIIFGLGVFVALIVGLAIVYQVLSSDIANRLPEYATLLAMGYGRRYLSWVVLSQALLMAVTGFLPGWLISYALYGVTAAGAHLPMDMTVGLTVGVFLVNLVMCALSGMLSLRKLNNADPADLFV